jgi:methylase of polypeptide subunit release factors
VDTLLDRFGIDLFRRTLGHYTVDSLHELIGLEGQLALSRGDLSALSRILARVDSPTAVLARLFLLGEVVTEREAGFALAPLSVAQAVGSALIARSGDHIRAELDVRPYAEVGGRNWWVISDFGSDVRPGPVSAEHVLGVGAASVSLAQATVRTPIGRALDIGTGCGIQALHLSEHAAHVTATDVSVRALRLARTCAALNSVEWDLRLGSLLDPVRDEQFDLIVANPPFVISAGDVSYEYRDSGMPGDELCRRLVTGLPKHLRPGGVAQLLANWQIGDGPDWAARLESWLEGSGCQAWIWQREVLDTSSYVRMWLQDAGELPGTSSWASRYDDWLRWFERSGVAAVGMGLINIQAAEGPVVAEDVRQDIEQPIGAAIGAWFARHSWVNSHTDEQLLTTALRVADDVELVTESVPSGAGWVTNSVRLRQARGLRWEVASDEAIAGLIGCLDGSVTLRTGVLILASAYGLTTEDCERAVVAIARDLVTRGFLVPA